MAAVPEARATILFSPAPEDMIKKNFSGLFQIRLHWGRGHYPVIGKCLVDKIHLFAAHVAKAKQYAVRHYYILFGQFRMWKVARESLVSASRMW